MSFQQGLSGLNSSSKALDVVSNNIANANTVGFKSSATHFADVYANSLAGAGASQVGIGVQTAAIMQQFSQGNISSTNNPLDMSINGGGFYRMTTNGNVTYSRNGQFHLDKNGYIVDDRARVLTGYPVDGTGQIVQSAPVDLQLDAGDQDPVATGAGVGALTGVRANVNLDSRSISPLSAAPPAPWVPGATHDPSTYNWSTALSIYDTLGNAHTLSLYAIKTATPGVWDIRATVDGTTDTNVALGTPTTPPTLPSADLPAKLQFKTSGQIDETVTDNGIVSVLIDLDAVLAGLKPPQTNSAAQTLSFDINFAGSSQSGSTFGANRLEQDGYASGRLSGVSVSGDGVIRGNYTNGQSRNLGQVVLANFTNPNGLTSLGGNQWGETSTSGTALIGSPGSASLGVLQSAAVEESNVDLTAELVNMITQQRNYQANAQSIKTQDSIMQTLVNLR